MTKGKPEYQKLNGIARNLKSLTDISHPLLISPVEASFLDLIFFQSSNFTLSKLLALNPSLCEELSLALPPSAIPRRSLSPTKNLKEKGSNLRIRRSSACIGFTQDLQVTGNDVFGNALE
ncbi:uncharacterized protein LOC104884546 [Beta vulgaris subsp. vulgaris]|uniref:uncharacterized protein LOC104884546 n=1 Tax=Beta vulgaris subsp. vulgaris TaxID=3555 RepID=UPI002547C58D|nr:uncharacterized protein LOC104884546 [Beta vulgaris subsp. vulgaris]